MRTDPAPAILKRLAEIDKTRLLHDGALRDIYEKLRPLVAPPPLPEKPQIGFHIKEDGVPYGLRKSSAEHESEGATHHAPVLRSVSDEGDHELAAPTRPA